MNMIQYQEAQIYCYATIYSMNRMLESPLEKDSLELQISELEKYIAEAKWGSQSPEMIVQTIVREVRYAVKAEGWSLSDVDGVSWFIGLYSEAYVRAQGGDFIKLFIVCYIKYFYPDAE